MINFAKLFNDDRFLKILSVVIAVVGWFIVVGIISPQTTSPVINEVPIVLSANAQTMTRLQLEPVTSSSSSVDISANGEYYVIGHVGVEVVGKRYIVSNIKAEDILVEPVLTGVTSAGTYKLELVAKDRNDKGIDSFNIKQENISVKFERKQSKTFTLEANIIGANLPENYIMETPYVVPGKVNLTGSEAELDKVVKCVVRVEINERIEKTTTFSSVVSYYDKNGNLIENSNILSDVEQADVVVPILKKKKIPIKFNYLNQPKFFPVNELEYTMSADEIEIAGAADVLESYNEIVIGYVDFKSLRPESPYVFNVNVASGFTNVKNIQAVTVEFLLEDMVERNFFITQVGLVNKPVNFDVTVNASTLDMKLIGPKEVMDSLTYSDVIAEIDFADRNVVAGQMKMPVNIYLPNKGLVWAVGDYSAFVTIKEK